MSTTKDANSVGERSPANFRIRELFVYWHLDDSIVGLAMDDISHLPAKERAKRYRELATDARREAQIPRMESANPTSSLLPNLITSSYWPMPKSTRVDSALFRLNGEISQHTLRTSWRELRHPSWEARPKQCESQSHQVLPKLYEIVLCFVHFGTQGNYLVWQLEWALGARLPLQFFEYTGSVDASLILYAENDESAWSSPVNC